MAMATIIAVSGKAWVKDAEGNLRVVQSGDVLQVGEIIITAEGASVTMAYSDGRDPVVIGGATQIALNAETGEGDLTTELAVESADVAAIIDLLENADGDLLDDLEEPAAGLAGGGAGNEGHYFVRLLRIAEDVDPLSYEFNQARQDGIVDRDGAGFGDEPNQPVSLTGLDGPDPGNPGIPGNPGNPGNPGEPIPGNPDNPDDDNYAATFSGAEQFVWEAGLADGSAPNSDLVTRSGNFGFSTPDGLQALVVGGRSLDIAGLQGLSSSPITLETPFGTLLLTGFSGDETGGTISYTYILSDNIENDIEPGATDEGILDSISVIATDTDGSTATGSLDIAIIDDVPAAIDDRIVQADEDENQAVEGNVLVANGTDGRADIFGADGKAAPPSYVALVDGSLTGTGELELSADGSFKYTPGTKEEGEVRFDYTITDGDGDTSTATVTLDLADDSKPTVVVPPGTPGEPGTPPKNPENPDYPSYPVDPASPNVDGSLRVVDEAGLSDGSRFGDSDANTRVSGVFHLDTKGDDLQSLVIIGADVATDVTAAGEGENDGIEVRGEYGTLVVTKGEDGLYKWDYTLSDNTTSHNSQGTAPDNVRDIFKLTVTDSDGDSDQARLGIDVRDDVPVVVATGPIQAVEGGDFIEGSWGVTPGADGEGVWEPQSTNTNPRVWLVDDKGNDIGGPYSLGDSIGTGAGELTVNSDNTWRFKATGSTGKVDVHFRVEAIDGDGDTTSDSHTITITDGEGPTIVVPPSTDDNTVSAEVLDLTLQDEDTLADATDSDMGRLRVTAGSDPVTRFEFGNDVDSIKVDGNGLGKDGNGDDYKLEWRRDEATGNLIGKLLGVDDDGNSIEKDILTLSLDKPSSIAANSSGDVTVIASLADNLPHSVGADSLVISGVTVVATDSDESSSDEAPVTVTVEDDTPDAVDFIANDLTEDTTTTTVSGDVFDTKWSTDNKASQYGADGKASANSLEWTEVYVTLNGNTPVEGVAELEKYGRLTQDPDGTWSFDLDNNLKATQELTEDDRVKVELNYDINDSDSDTDGGTIEFGIQGVKDTASITSPGEGAGEGAGTVYEAGLDGIGSGADDDATRDSETTYSALDVKATSGIQSVTIGNPDAADNPHGRTISIEELQKFNNGIATDDPNIEFTAGKGTIKITGYQGKGGDDGSKEGTISYSYTLNNPQTHPDDTVEQNTIGDVIDVSVESKAGSDNGKMTITIVDDVPSVTITDLAMDSPDESNGNDDDTTVTVAEGNTVNGTWMYEGGADGVSNDNVVFTVPGDNTKYTFGGKDEITIDTASGELKIQRGGTWGFTADEGLDHSNSNVPQQSFKITVTDGDDDVAEETHTIKITDSGVPTTPETDNDPSTSPDMVTLDEDGLLPGGIAGGAGDVAGEVIIMTGRLGYSFGPDGPADAGSFSWLMTDGLSKLRGDGQELGWVLSNEGKTLTAGIMTTDLSNLRGDDSNLRGNGQEMDWVLSNEGKTPTVGVTDGNTPAAITKAFLVIELTDADTGAYSVTLKNALDHPEAGIEDNIEREVEYQVTDADGSTAKGKLNVIVNDDMPMVSANSTADSVAEDGLSTTAEGDVPGDLVEGNREVTDDDKTDDETSGAAGTLTRLFRAGADEPLTIGLSSDVSGMPTLYSGGVKLSYAVTTGSKQVDGNTVEFSTLTAKKDSNNDGVADTGEETIFVLTVNGDGSYRFDLRGPLDHVDDDANGENTLLRSEDDSGNPTSVESIDFSGVLTATDYDGDTVTAGSNGSGYFTIQVVDDIPVASAAAGAAAAVTGSVAESGMSRTAANGDPADKAEGNKAAASDIDGDGDIDGDDRYTNSSDEVSDTTDASDNTLTALFSVGADAPIEKVGLVAGDVASKMPTLFSGGVKLAYKVETTGSGAASVSTLTAKKDSNNDGIADAGESAVFVLTVKGDGSYTFDLQGQLDHVDDDANGENTLLRSEDDSGNPTSVESIDFSGVLTATDYDGDTVTAGSNGSGYFTIQVVDDIPVASAAAGAAAAVTGSVAESGMSRTAANGDPADKAEGNKAAASDIDGDGDIDGDDRYTNSSDEVSDTTDASDNTLTALFSVGADAPIEKVGLVAGDVASKMPTLFSGGVKLAYKVETTGSGAASVSTLTAKKDSNNDGIADAGESAVFVLTVKGDGSYTFDLQGQLDHVDDDANGENTLLRSEDDSGNPTSVESIDFSGVLTATDYDGDTVTAGSNGSGYFTIQVVDDIPVASAAAGAAAAVTGSVAESGMSRTAANGDPADKAEGNKAAASDIDGDGDIDGDDRYTNSSDEVSDTTDASDNTLTALFSVGADAPIEKVGLVAGDVASKMPTLFSGGVKLAYKVETTGSGAASVSTLTAKKDSNNDGIADAGESAVFVLTVKGDGSYTFDLQGQLDHVDDDANGENTLLRSEDDSGNSTSVESIDFSGVLTATDYDGDTVTAGSNGSGYFTIQVVDDIPVASAAAGAAAAVTGSVAESGMSRTAANGDPADKAEGNKAAASDIDGDGDIDGDDRYTNSSDEVSDTTDASDNTLTALFSVGADAPIEKVGLVAGDVASKMPTLFSGGVKLAYKVETTGSGAASVSTLTAKKDSNNDGIADAGESAVFVLTVKGDGSYTFDLQGQLDHVDDDANGENTLLRSEDDSGNPTSVESIDFSGVLTATDYDGDTVTAGSNGSGYFTIQVVDDIPVASAAAGAAAAVTGSVAESGMSRTAANGDPADKAEGNKAAASDIDGDGDIDGDDRYTNSSDEVSDTTDASDNTLTALFSVGADAPIEKVGLVAGDVASKMPTLFSGGVKLAYKVETTGSGAASVSTLTAKKDSNNDGIADAGESAVFVLTVKGDGSYTFDLQGQLDHVDDDANGENTLLRSEDDSGNSTSVESIDFSGVLTATDYDGDTVTAGSNGSGYFTIQVVDDIPVASAAAGAAAAVTGSVAESGMSRTAANGDPADKAEGNKAAASDIDGDGDIDGDDRYTNSSDEVSDTTDASDNTLTALFSVGADAPIEKVGLVAGDVASKMPTLFSGGVKLAYKVETTGSGAASVSTLTAKKDSNNDGIADAGESAVFVLTVKGDGSYTFDLQGQLDHVDDDANGENTLLRSEDDSGNPTSVESIDFSGVLTATDYDGDTVTAGSNGSGYFTIQVVDDIPVASAAAGAAAAVTGSVAESGMSRTAANGDPADKAEGNKAAASDIDGDGDIDGDDRYTNSSDEVSDTTDASDNTLTALFSVGADAPIEKVGLVAGDVASKMPTLFSGGVKLAYKVETTGSGAASVSTLTAKKDSNNDGIADAGESAVFVLTVKGDGSYTFDLQGQLDHVDDDANGENTLLRSEDDSGNSTSVESIDFSGVLTATDYDGDTVTAGSNGSGYFTIQVVDDIPVASAAAGAAAAVTGSVAESGMSRTAANGDPADKAEGNKAAASDIDGDGDIDGDDRYTNSSDEVSDTTDASDNTLTALFSVGADAPIEKVGLVAGDVASKMPTLFSGGVKLAYKVETTGSGAASVSTLTAKKDSNNDGIADAGESAVFVLTVKGDGSYTFDLQGQLDHVDDDANGENTLLRSEDDSGNPTSVESIDFSGVLTATDYDGDTVTAGSNGSGYFTIQVVDDIPVASAAAGAAAAVTGSVAESGMSRTAANGDPADKAEGNKAAASDIDGDGDIDGDDRYTNSSDEVSDTTDASDNTLTALFSVGADAPIEKVGLVAGDVASKMPTLFSGGVKLAYKVETTGSGAASVSTLTAKKDSNNDGIADDGESTIFVLTVNGDGSYAFDLQGPLDHVDDVADGENTLLRSEGAMDDAASVESIDFSGVLTGTDYDGDTVDAGEVGDGYFTIKVQDDVPTAASAEPITGNSSFVKVEGSGFGYNNDNITFSNEIRSVDSFTVTGASTTGVAVDIYELDNSFNLKINGTLISDEQLQFQKVFDNAEPSSSNHVRFLDGSGFSPSVWEQSREEGDPIVRVVIDDEGNVKIYGSRSPDAPLEEMVVYDGQPNAQKTNRYVFDKVNWDGDSNNEETVEIFQQLHGLTRISGEAYQPSEIATEFGAVVDEDGLMPDGVPGGAGDVVGEKTFFEGTLRYAFGADSADSFTWLTDGLPTDLTSGGEAVTWSVRYDNDGNGKTLAATANIGLGGAESDVLLVTLTDLTTGAYTVELKAPLDHSKGFGFDENNIVFTASYRLTDADGDTAKGGLNILVDDDSPKALDDEPEGAAPGTPLTPFEVEAGKPITIDVLTNDMQGADGASVTKVELVELTSTEREGAADGSRSVVVVNDDGKTISFQPEHGFEGVAKVRYTLTDADGDISTATAEINVSCHQENLVENGGFEDKPPTANSANSADSNVIAPSWYQSDANSDFEYSGEYDDKPDNFIYDNNVNSKNNEGLFNRIEGGQANDNGSVRLIVDSSDAAVVGKLGELYPGETYEYAFDLRRFGQKAVDANYGKYIVQLYNADSNEIVATKVDENDLKHLEYGNLADLPDNNQEFKSFSGTFTVNSEANYYVLFKTTGQGTAESNGDYSIDRVAFAKACEMANPGDTKVVTSESGNLSGGEKDDTLYGASGDNELSGGKGNDVLYGGAGNDTLTGGKGDDVLVPGMGSDVLKWSLADKGYTGNPAEDVVINFDLGDYNDTSGSDADQLDIADLLVGENTDNNIGNYLYAEEDGKGNTVLHISSAGEFGGPGNNADAVDQTITLAGVSIGTTDFIQQLFDDGQLKITE